VADLATLAEVKDYMSQSGSGEDTRLNLLISGVSEEIQKWVGRTLTTAVYVNEVHTVREDRMRRLATKHWPVIMPTASSADIRALVATMSDEGFMFNDGDVDTSTDQIAEEDHGLNTGDGPFIIVNDGKGTVPTGLTARTQDYYVIRIDEDNIQLATTEALADAGTQVDITAASGGGQHFLVGPNILDKDLEVEIDTGSVYRANGVYWPRGFRNVKFAYQAGYGTAGSGIPKDLVQAVAKQVAFEHLNTGTKGRVGRKSSTLAAGGTEEFVVREWAHGVLNILDGYKHKSFLYA
jgi:hypothetical protein